VSYFYLSGHFFLAGSATMARTESDHHQILLTNAALDITALVDWCVEPHCGAVASFIGTTRNNFEGRTVLRLEYEAYEPMALTQMQGLAAQMQDKWPDLGKVVIAHRLGEVPIGESSVLIAASSPHRREALEAVSWAIDELKAVVPIWKQEVYQEGERVWKENRECRHGTRRDHD
jgi:molybdopterin synthase catalytic subunit